jgi:hypothetical protein
MPWIAETANSPNSCVILLVSSYITLFSARCLFSCQIQHQFYQIFVQYVCQISEQIIMYVSTTAVRCWWGHQCTVLPTDYYHLWYLDTLQVTLLCYDHTHSCWDCVLGLVVTDLMVTLNMLLWNFLSNLFNWYCISLIDMQSHTCALSHVWFFHFGVQGSNQRPWCWCMWAPRRLTLQRQFAP